MVIAIVRTLYGVKCKPLVFTWYQLRPTWYRTYDVIDVILLSSKSAVWTTDSTEVGRGIYCFDKIKYKHVCNVDCVY